MKTVDVNNVSIPNFIVSFRGLSENDSMAFNEDPLSATDWVYLGYRKESWGILRDRKSVV